MSKMKVSEYRNAENEEGQFALEQSWSADKKMELDSAKSNLEKLLLYEER